MLSSMTAEELRVVLKWLNSELAEESAFQQEVVQSLRRNPWRLAHWRDGIISAVLTGIMDSQRETVQKLIPIIAHTEQLREQIAVLQRERCKQMQGDE